jgi:hypothetical protein
MESAADTVLILGAGAVVDAGAPDAFDLTVRIRGVLENHANRSDGSPYDPSPAQFRMFNAVLGLLIAHRAAAGQDPLKPPDAETVMSVVRLLATRREDDLASFTSEWHHYLNVRSSNFTSDQLLQGLNDRLPSAVAEILAGVGWAKVDYLVPLIAWAQRGATLVTLNYDRLIEAAAERAEVNLYLGLEDLAQESAWTEPDGSVPVIKLHGSIDWQLTPKAVTSDSDLRYVAAERVGSARTTPGRRAAPGIIFGGREKASFEGPFLRLYTVFREKLRNARQLIAIGYSFRDDHVNASIAEWIASGSAERLIVIDPGFPEHRESGRWSPHSYQDELNWALAEGRHACHLEVHRKKAAEVIPQVFQ